MRILLLITLLFVTTVKAQQEKDKILFSEAIAAHLKDYNKEVDYFLEKGELKHAKSLFDTLVTHNLQGTYMDALSFDGYKTYFQSTEDFEKPTILLTYTSWCIPSESEIPALNALAQKYGDLMDFVVLYWDKKNTVKKHAK
ncbi:MAG: hypothetical protein V7767_10355, partial [Leeuwenhoekiella sp.]